jgi:hypothetical protein
MSDVLVLARGRGHTFATNRTSVASFPRQVKQCASHRCSLVVMASATTNMKLSRLLCGLLTQSPDKSECGRRPLENNEGQRSHGLIKEVVESWECLGWTLPGADAHDRLSGHLKTFLGMDLGDVVHPGMSVFDIEDPPGERPCDY